MSDESHWHVPSPSDAAEIRTIVDGLTAAIGTGPSDPANRLALDLRSYLEYLVTDASMTGGQGVATQQLLRTGRRNLRAKFPPEDTPRAVLAEIEARVPLTTHVRAIIERDLDQSK